MVRRGHWFPDVLVCTSFEDDSNGHSTAASGEDETRQRRGGPDEAQRHEEAIMRWVNSARCIVWTESRKSCFGNCIVCISWLPPPPFSSVQGRKGGLDGQRKGPRSYAMQCNAMKKIAEERRGNLPIDCNRADREQEVDVDVDEHTQRGEKEGGGE